MITLLHHFFTLFSDNSASSIIGSSSKLVCTGGGCNEDTVSTILANVVQTLVYIIGSVSVIMILVGGFRYVISNGDPKNISSAKATIMYAVIGLIVALLGYAIVRFVITQLG